MAVMSGRRKRRQLVDECIARVGPKRGAFVDLYVVEWAIVARSVGHFPSIGEFVSWTGDVERSVERRSSKIRHAFTEDEFRSLVEQLVASDVDDASRWSLRGLTVAL
jgi:hypothetical protein